MITIQISEALELPEGLPAIPADSPLLPAMEAAALAACRRAGPPDEVDLTVVLADDRQLQALNNQFLGIDSPTDVLSFPDGEVDPDSERVYLGDVLISYPRAAAQAAAGGHALQAELQLLVVHGVLHLCGHDHADEDQQQRMWAVQAAALGDVACEISGPKAAA